MSDKDIEQEIQEKGLTAPRVTPDDLKANIAHIEIVKHVSVTGQVLRWAVLTTQNGFAVTGKPSCSVSSENDDPSIGKSIAVENAENELWALMGYALKQRLHDESAPAYQQDDGPLTGDQIKAIQEESGAKPEIWENEDDCRKALEG